MSKLDEAGLPKAPEGMHWYLNPDYDGNIRLALMARYKEGETRMALAEYRVIKSVWVVDAGEDFPQTITSGLLVNHAHDILKWWEIMQENRTWLGVTGRDA